MRWLFFALPCPLWYQSRKLVFWRWLWTTIVICLPRLYLGYHWPIDVVGGAISAYFLMATVAGFFRGSRFPINCCVVGRVSGSVLPASLFSPPMRMRTFVRSLRHIAVRRP